SHWFAQVEQPGGDRLDVIVDPGDSDRRAIIEPAVKLFRWAMKNEPRILRAALRAELLHLYNDTWRQGREAQLSAKGPAGQLKWSLLTHSASKIVPIEFSCEVDELFGGHGVPVGVNKDLQFRDVELRG